MMHAWLRSWVAKLLSVVLLAAGVGLGFGWWFNIRSDKNPLLRFEQSEIDLRERKVIEGEPIEVVANLHNFGNVPLRIIRMPVSCGCTVIAGDTKTPPFEIMPGASMPVHLRIGTLLRCGEERFWTRAEGVMPDGREIAAELIVSAYIRTLLEAQPKESWFVLHEEELSAPLKQTVVLADLWPGDGLPIKSITSTLGDKLHYQLLPAHGKIGIGPRMLHQRYNLKLSLTLDPTKTAFDHTVTITPDHPKAKPVEVHLYGKIIPRCGLNADSIAFCGTKPDERIVRRIEYHYRDASDGDIRLIKAPPWLSTSVSEVREGLKVVTLTCTLPECKVARAEEACFEFGRNKKRSALPLFVSCQDNPRPEG